MTKLFPCRLQCSNHLIVRRISLNTSENCLILCLKQNENPDNCEPVIFRDFSVIYLISLIKLTIKLSAPSNLAQNFPSPVILWLSLSRLGQVRMWMGPSSVNSVSRSIANSWPSVSFVNSRDFNKTRVFFPTVIRAYQWCTSLVAPRVWAGVFELKSVCCHCVTNSRPSLSRLLSWIWSDVVLSGGQQWPTALRGNKIPVPSTLTELLSPSQVFSTCPHWLVLLFSVKDIVRKVVVQAW